MTGFPWRSRRCIYCHDLAVTQDADNNPVCAVHSGKRIPNLYKNKADEACNDLIDLVGKQEYCRRLDERFPGPDDMKIPDRERYEWAINEIGTIKQERSILESHNCVTWREAEILRQQYYCSDCWDELHAETTVDPELYLVKCSTPRCTTPGFVSGASIKFRKRKADEYHYLAKKSLRAAFNWLGKFDSESARFKLAYKLGISNDPVYGFGLHSRL
jgi:hypothetical protein